MNRSESAKRSGAGSPLTFDVSFSKIMLLYDKKVTSHFVGDPSLAKARLLSAQLADAPSQKVRLRSLTLSLLRMTHKGETGANI